MVYIRPLARPSNSEIGKCGANLQQRASSNLNQKYDDLQGLRYQVLALNFNKK